MAQPTSPFVLSVLAVGVLVGDASAASIDHTAVACVVAEQFPRFEARLIPADAIGRARVFFRSEGDGQCFTLTIRAAGLPTYSVNGDWGGSAGYTFSLSPQQPTQASRPCPAQ